MIPLGILLRIQNARPSEKVTAQLVYEHCEPSPTHKQALAFARHILNRLEAGENPNRIPDLWCFRCWSAATKCECQTTPIVPAAPDKPQIIFPREWFDKYGNFKPEVLEGEANSE